MFDYKNFSLLLKKNGISSQELSIMMKDRGFKIGKDTVDSYRKGAIKNPKLEVLEEIAIICKTNIIEFFENKETLKDDIIKQELKNSTSKYHSLVPVNNPNMIDIKYYEDIYACQGSSFTDNSSEIWKPITFDKTFLQKQLPTIKNFDNLHIINTIGNSMEPTINEGELLIVSPFKNDNESIISGAIYTVMYYDQAFVKRIVSNPKTNEITLHSDNEKIHPSITIENEDKNHFKIIGRVLAHFNFL